MKRIDICFNNLVYKYKFCKIIEFGAINNPKELFQEIKGSEKL